MVLLGQVGLNQTTTDLKCLHPLVARACLLILQQELLKVFLVLTLTLVVVRWEVNILHTIHILWVGPTETILLVSEII